jgi:tetratricopeptide (TPR) repeat protein
MATGVAASLTTAWADRDESMKRRTLLTHAAAVMVGAAVLGADRGLGLSRATPTRAPGRIGMTEAAEVETTTQAMRVLDYQFGGGVCRDAIITQLSRAQRLLEASGTEKVRQRLFRALGDLQNLAGWTTFDVGLPNRARSHFATALDYAQQCGDLSLESNILYRIGRVYLHHGEPLKALQWFQRGQIAAQDCGSRLATAVLCGNEAWAYAMMGNAAQATTLLGRSQENLTKADLAEAPDWARFYNDTDLYAMIGTVHTELSALDPHHASTAIRAFDQALARYDDSMNRSQAFTVTMLATSHLRHGNLDHGIQVGHQALALAREVKSQRISDRMKPLQIETRRRSTHADSRELSDLIQQHRQHRGI